MMTREEAIDFGRASALAAIDQRRSYADLQDARDSHRENVRDTLNDERAAQHEPEAFAEFDRVFAEEAAKLAPPTPQAAKKPVGAGIAAHALAAEIIEALLADEKDGGYDLTAGMFGKNFSRMVRRWAALELTAPHAPELLEYVASSASNGCAEAKRLLANATGSAT